MKQEVEQAIQELRRCFNDAEVIFQSTADGGAIVTIAPIDLGPVYIPQQTWIKFEIGFQYPCADIYPLYVQLDLARADGYPHGEGIAEASFQGERALQLSRRSNHLNPEIDTATLKVTKVIQWLKER